MQETYYRISIELKNKDYTQKRKELLEKVEFLNTSLKENGHSGRYGLKGLYCFASRPTIAQCIASIEHEKDFPWLQETLDKIKQDESDTKIKQHKAIDKAIDKFQKLKEDGKKEEYLKNIKYDKMGIAKGEVTVENFIEKLNEKKQEKQVFSTKDFVIDELFIEPLKPTKKELLVEMKYAASIEKDESSHARLNEMLGKKYGPSDWKPWEPGQREQVKISRKKFDEKIRKNIGNA